MSWRAGVLLCATVLSCWFVSLTSAHTWDSDTDVFEDEVDQEPLLSGVDESMLRSLIIRKVCIKKILQSEVIKTFHFLLVISTGLSFNVINPAINIYLFYEVLSGETYKLQRNQISAVIYTILLFRTFTKVNPPTK